MMAGLASPALMDGGGRTITLVHTNGYRSVYMHLSAYNVTKGDSVSTNQLIGLSGGSNYYYNKNTGKWVLDDNGYAAHLHFQIQRNSDSASAINPLPKYHPDDKRANDTNPNPVFVQSGGKWVFNTNFNWKYYDSYYCGVGGTEWKKK